MAISWAHAFDRMSIPVIVATFMLYTLGPEQTALFSKIQKESDKILSIAKGEGNITKNEKFDFIIIGGGSAGAVLLKRLTESGKYTVLLLEAGGDPNPVSDVPGAYSTILESDMIVPYTTVKQSMACLENNGICESNQGNALGGGSSVNGVYYDRGNVNDYDSLAKYLKDSIWRLENILDAFKVIESYNGFYKNQPGGNLNHGSDGEMNIGRIEFKPGTKPFFKAVAEKGYPIRDINSLVSQYGFSLVDNTIKDGLRWSTYHGFIQPILDRPNLYIYRYSTAIKIHLNTKKRAVGVTYQRHGLTRYAKAKKEIIVAAGTLISPKILMLSGIGPREHLTKHGIKTFVDIGSVGAHLGNHIGVYLPRFTLNMTFGIKDYTIPANIYQYITTASGPLAILAGPFKPSIAIGYLVSKMYKDQTSWPDIRDFFQPEGKPEEETLLITVDLVKSDQTGTVRLASSNPDDYPLIDPRYLENQMDLERIIDGVEEVVDFLMNSKTYQALGIKWSENDGKVPECQEFEFATREYWRCYIPIKSYPRHHFTSTCRMGPNRSLAVVNSRLRVFGTTALRVIDASVMPFVVNGNLPSIMIGEMGARIILNQI